MVDIFKPRKIPKHLIIQEDSRVPGKRLITIPRLLVCSLVILALAWLVLQYR
jgi:hypothetical protein